MNRKTRFWAGFLFVVLLYSLPIAGLIAVGWLLPIVVVLAAFLFSVYMVYRITIKNIKPKYPILNPEGHPDVYSGRMPRPIYEDMERYPWFFRKKHSKNEKKKIRKHER